MYVGMIEARSLKILLKNFQGNYSDLFKKNMVQNEVNDYLIAEIEMTKDRLIRASLYTSWLGVCSFVDVRVEKGGNKGTMY